MKERPILFNAQMVRAILEGRKTQTRRLAKVFNDFGAADVHVNAPGEFVGWSDRVVPPEFTAEHYPEGTGVCCPQGRPGDRLYVRETWGYEYGGGYLYRESHAHMMPGDGRWRPSIHMPRAASRITLEITGVRVERLNDISESDAIAEGIESFRPVPGDGPGSVYDGYIYKDYTGKNAVPCFITDPRESFRTLWESVYGPESWYSNPWVWVIEFKKI